MKKIILILLTFFIIGCNQNNLEKKSEPVPNISYETLKPVQTEFEYGNLYKLKDIFSNDNVEFIDDYLDISTLGENSIDIEYILDGTLYKENYLYTVVDTTKPLVWLSGSYSIYVGDTKDALDKIICADNYDKKPNCYVEGNFDTTTPGSYKLRYIAEDSNGNTESINFTLYVKEKSNATSKRNTTRTNIVDVIAKYKNENTMIGMDVSKYQGDIDWEKVKNSGIEFAIIRLGIGYDDVLKLDEKFIQNIEGALANNVQVGIYFYSYAINKKEAVSHAEYVIKNIKKYDVTFPIAFDWENFASWNEYGISLNDLRSISRAFQDKIKEYGYTPVQYGSRNYLRAFWVPVKYDTWVAHYTVGMTDYENDYIMWQLCDNGLVPGINGDVDLDVYYIQKAQ